MVDPATFTATRFPVTFYLGSENYVKTVVTNGDGKAAITRYLAGGGTLVILGTGPFPLYYGYGPNDQPGPADPVLPGLGLPIYNAFEQAPLNLHMVVSTNQTIFRSVPSVFPFPPGDSRLRSINRSQVVSTHRYVPWLTVTGPTGQNYGDAAGFISFGSGPAKGGKILYIWSSLLSGPQGIALLSDALSWLMNATFNPSTPGFNSISFLDTRTLALGFAALPDLAYKIESRTALNPSGTWAIAQDYGSAPGLRALRFTNTITIDQSRFFRLAVEP
jgi:hypothetical protein